MNNYDINYENNKILDYAKVTNKKCNEEIVTINPRLFDHVNNISKYNSNVILYPVLTISNNSDIERWQYDDSYIVIE